MRVRRRSLVLVMLGGLLATTAGLGATHEVWGEPVGTAPIADTEPDTVSGLADEAPELDELQLPPPNTDEAPKLEELQLPTRNILLTPTAVENVRKTIGKLYVEFPDGTKPVGTATVVTSGSGDLLVTAASLLSKGQQLATKVRFEPAVANGRESLGVWHAREWSVVPGSGIGMVLLYPRARQHIQQAVRGSQGICFDCARKAFVHVYGYPKEVGDGNDLDLHCQVNGDFSAGPDHPYGPCLEGIRAMGEGSEGSAALTNFDPTTGYGLITAVHTRAFLSQAGWPVDQGAAFLDNRARDLYQRLTDKHALPVTLTIRVTNRGGYDAATTVLLPGGEQITDCDIHHLAIPQTVTRKCTIPGGGSFVVRGEAISSPRKSELTFPAVPSSTMCFTHYGTTFGFHLVNEPCT